MDREERAIQVRVALWHIGIVHDTEEQYTITERRSYEPPRYEMRDQWVSGRRELDEFIHTIELRRGQTWRDGHGFS